MACITALTELRKLLTSDTNRKVHLIFAQEEEQKMLLAEEIAKAEEKEKEVKKEELREEEEMKEKEENVDVAEEVKEEKIDVEEEREEEVNVGEVEIKVQVEIKEETEEGALKQKEDEILEKEGLTREKEGYIISKNMPMIDYLNYLGTIELGINMAKCELIDWATFCAHFGYRIENIFDEEKNPNHIKIREYINNNKTYYKSLLWAKEEMKKKIIQ